MLPAFSTVIEFEAFIEVQRHRSGDGVDRLHIHRIRRRKCGGSGWLCF